MGETDVKPNLQDITDYKLMTLKECFDAVGWTYEENGSVFTNITCGCGKRATFYTFIGVESVECDACGISIKNAFSMLPTGNATCTILDPDDYIVDENRHWFAITKEGGILLDRNKTAKEVE